MLSFVNMLWSSELEELKVSIYCKTRCQEIAIKSCHGNKFCNKIITNLVIMETYCF